MKLFGRERETLRVKKVKVSRAVYESTEIQRAEITLMVEDGQLLTLELTADGLHALLTQGRSTYEAIRPSLRSGGGMADWRGMDE